jgi:hypothetical protein
MYVQGVSGPARLQRQYDPVEIFTSDFILFYYGSYSEVGEILWIQSGGGTGEMPASLNPGQ